jgi:hypothetical protein
MTSFSSLTPPIFEPEFNFLPHGCECGARFAERSDLELHKRETCGRRFDARFKQPSITSFDLDGPGGVADGGRRM